VRDFGPTPGPWRSACRPCRDQVTTLTARVADDYRALRHHVGGRLVPRDVLAVRGPDAVSYLQGQCSQDVAALSVGESADALLLGPQGKLDALVRVWRGDEDGFLLDVEGGWGAVVRERLERFKLRVKASVDTLELECLALRGPDAAGAAQGVAGDHPLAFSWNGVTGVDVFGRALSIPNGIRACGTEAWEALRVEAGIPAMGSELDDRTIAAEADLLERCVSFTKGCYTGQELVARLDARGNKVSRHLVGFVVSGPPAEAGGLEVPGGHGGAPLPAGTAVFPGGAQDGEDGEGGGSGEAREGTAAGAITSSAWSPALGVVALGYLHRRVAPPAAVVLRTPGGQVVPAEARPLPLAR